MALSHKPAALGFIFTTLLIDVAGLSIIIPVLPDVIKQLVHGDLSVAASYSGWLTFAYAIMQFIMAPVLGNLSDRYGRRPVLLFSLAGFGLDYLLQGFAPTIAWLFIGRIIAGITGASFTTASAYIADISTPEKRAQNFGLIGAAFGLGFIIGPAIGGLLGQYGARLPFFVAAGFSLVNALFGYFVLPESLPPEKRRAFSWKRANPVGSLLNLRKYPALGGLVISLIFVYVASHAIQSVWTFYNMEKFGWSKLWVGLSLAFFGVLIAFVQGVLIRKAVPMLGQKRCIYIGLLLYSAGYVLFAFAGAGWMMFVFMIIYSLGGIAGPALQSLITGHVPASEQGDLQGALTSLISATAIIGPPMMTSLFRYFTSKSAPVHFPGAPFLMGSVLILISAVVAYRTLKKNHTLVANA